MKITKANLILAGRVIYGLVLIAFAYGHFTNGAAMAGYVPKYFPNGIYWVYLVGICLLLAGISIIINRASWAAGIGMAVLLGVIIATIHIPALAKNPMAFTNILKDAAMAAAALIIAGMDPDGEKVESKNKSNKNDKKHK